VKYVKSGKESLDIEMKALQSLYNNSMNDTFDELIDAILNTKGKVILSAIGKPGYIAHKIAATLASTGTPSYYIHSDEASHGDLGMIENNDMVIVLSASGESKELKDIINYCKRYNIVLVGVTRDNDSFLSHAANISIVFEKIEETNFLNSPTTSSLMFLAYFDAVITTLIDVKKIDIEKYKQLHPGGKLGASMIKIEEIMFKGDDLPLADELDTIDKIISVSISKNLGCVAILDKKNKVSGIITDGDYKRKILTHSNLLSEKAIDIMTKNPITINVDKFAIEAVGLMQGNNEKNRYIQTLLVVNDDNEMKGILHIQSLLKAGII
jgi:arabinose-5-phosphate isomerase